MLGKKSCPRCGKRLNSKYEFCPFCGNILEKKEKDFGMLGKTDAPAANPGVNIPNQNMLPMGFNSIFNSLMRNLERQFKDVDKSQEKPKNQNPMNQNGISISISAFPGFPQQMRVNPSAEKKSNQKKQNDIKKFFFGNLSSESFKNFSKLSKKEPETNMRRVGDKIIYEVELPGVKSAKDVSILNLESSMELKAVAGNKAYSKVISMSLPITNYEFSNEKLTLELDASGN